MPIAGAPPLHFPTTAHFAGRKARKHVKLVAAAAAINGHETSAALRVAFQGAPGAYSERAARASMPSCITVPCRSFSDAVVAVDSGVADRAILPVESTLEDAGLRNYDLVLRSDLAIAGEVSLFVHYCLLAMPGVQTAELRRVISHPMALAHCVRALASLGPGVVTEPVEDTAGAVEMLRSRRLLDTAAIASPRAALLYGLDILAAGFQDESWNVTRFLVLAKPQGSLFLASPSAKTKTSMVIAHRGSSISVVLRVLSAFSSRGINLTKLAVINSAEPTAPVMILDNRGALRAFPHALWVDCEGAASDGAVRSAMDEIKEFTVFVRVLGCYVADANIYDLK